MALITVLCEILEFYVRSCFNLCDLRTFLHMERKFLATVVFFKLDSTYKFKSVIVMLIISNIFFGIFCHFSWVDFIVFERKTPLTCIFLQMSHKNFVKTSLALSKESETIN